MSDWAYLDWQACSQIPKLLTFLINTISRENIIKDRWMRNRLTNFNVNRLLFVYDNHLRCFAWHNLWLALRNNEYKRLSVPTIKDVWKAGVVPDHNRRRGWNGMGYVNQRSSFCSSFISRLTRERSKSGDGSSRWAPQSPGLTPQLFRPS